MQIDSPLREAGGLPASVAEQLIVQSEYATRIEEFIATCMREKGFEYYPRPQTDKQQILAAGYDMPRDEFARTHGFGISNTNLFGAASPLDRNSGYTNSLNVTEYDSYRVALHGEDILKTPGSKTIRKGGCQLTAENSVAAPAWHDNFDWLETVSEELSQRLLSHPRILEIEESWTTCMADAGYSRWRTVEELDDSLSAEFYELLPTFLPFQGVGESDALIDALDEESRQSLEAFRAKEIALATASHNCSKVYEDEYQQIRLELEKSILSSNPIN